MSKLHPIPVVVALCGVAGVLHSPLQAQHPVEGTEWMISNLRPSGQPVIPIFDGYYVKADGTYDLCFGYMNFNTEEVLEIPLGPENFVEPAQFDGAQPSTFLEVPPPPNLFRRYFCTFVVNVPADWGAERVWWTLVQDGREFRVPGHLNSPNYQLEELHQFSRNSWAPVVSFVSPPGPEGRGRSGIRTSAEATVGTPLPLSIRVSPTPESANTRASEEGGGGGDGPRREWWVSWAKHQGPGEVTFAQDQIDLFERTGVAETTVTFAEPGTYVLRLQVIDTPGEGGSYQFHCCWTNAYVDVTVR
jgi:hypothetical protein